MTEEFIEKYCRNCERCIFERNATNHFYPYPTPDEFIPTYCGKVTEEGGNGILLRELESCINKIYEK